MNNYIDILGRAALFTDIKTENIGEILECLCARQTEYRRNEIIFLAGDELRNIGVVLSGQIQILKDDSLGNRTIVSSIGPSEIFGEAICCAGLKESPVTAVSSENSCVMLLDFARILNICSNTCSFHGKLIENMIFVLANKNIFMQNRIDIVAGKSLRARVMMYLNSFVSLQGNNIQIPLNREQMAEYLCVDRSALSHELIRMKKDGLIDYHRNFFTILSCPSQKPKWG